MACAGRGSVAVVLPRLGHVEREQDAEGLEGAERVREADPPRVQAILAALPRLALAAALHFARLKHDDELARRIAVTQLNERALVEYEEALNYG